MGKFLVAVISWALGGFILKLTTAIGIGFITYKGLYTLIESMIDLLTTAFQGLPSVVLDLLAIAGVPEGLSIITSAILTRAALNAASVFVGTVS